MKLLLSSLLLVTFINNLQGQDASVLHFSENGFNQITISTSLSGEDTYLKILDWVNKSYISSDDVILSKDSNQLIRIQGVSSSSMSSEMMGVILVYDTKYIAEFMISDNQLVIVISDITWYSEGIKTGDQPNYIYKNNGQLRNYYIDGIELLETKFNSLVESVVSHLDSKMSKQAAMEKLKEAKEHLDLELITQDEYDKLKDELGPIIKGE